MTNRKRRGKRLRSTGQLEEEEKAQEQEENRGQGNIGCVYLDWQHNAPHWWQTVARVERFWAGRILVLCELPESEEDLSPYKLRSDMRLLGGTWTPLFGWHGFGIAPQPKPKAASRALPKAAPKALPKAAPAPSKERWSSFKRKLTWKPIRRNGPNVAAVKQFLLKSGKPASNSRKTFKKWEESLLPGPLQTRYAYDVDRNFFECGGSRPGGGSEMPVLTEDALEIVYATY